MSTPCKIDTEIVGNIWFKQMVFEKEGDFKTGHAHNHDHVTFVTNGAVEVFEIINPGKEETLKSLGVFVAPSHIKVPAFKAHTVKAVEDNSTAYCLEAVRDTEGLVMTTDFSDPDWKEPKLHPLMPKK